MLTFLQRKSLQPISQMERLDNTLYGVIPWMVEEIHLFQNFFFYSSFLDAEIPQLEIHSLALTP